MTSRNEILSLAIAFIAAATAVAAYLVSIQ